MAAASDPMSNLDGSRRQSTASLDDAQQPLLAYNTSVRHGFSEISEKRMAQLAEGYYTYFADKRHETQGRPLHGDSVDGGDWRVTDRQRTVNAALVLCLHLGVDPPDIIKTQPAARLEAWVDPQQYADPKKAIDQIGKNLQAQYESLSGRTKYKQSLDPTIDDIKRFCVGLRRSARDDRILFHYNGHGVPRPTPSGEIWVFNRGYSQYIPLSVYELQTWLGAPVIYCYDCSGAGNIIRSFNEFVQKRKQHAAEDAAKAGNNPNSVGSSGSGAIGGGPGGGPGSGGGPGGSAGASTNHNNAYAYETCIQLGACEAHEVLPMNPDLPADLFTCCISTPVDTAVKWFLIRNGRGFASSGLDPSTVKIPGKITDRRTPLGELNWIFTAITDNIAWSMLEPKLFKRLFRQDLIVAAMFRNFLLARRVMRAHNCHPVSSPALPDTCDHPLWDSWDAAINHCLLQVATPNPTNDGRLFSDFFEQQLTAFEMWLNYQSTDVDKPPEQLPIVLQVLLSQIHRLRALSLLCRYLDLGPEAVKIALSIGFFIYVLKLLQSPAPELRPVLIFIWARIMAVHRPVQTDLVKDNGYTYFVNILVEPHEDVMGFPSYSGKPGDAAICSFILAQFAHDYQHAKSLLISNETLLNAVERNLESETPLVRQWSVLLLAELVPMRSLSYVLWRLKDPIPEIRAAVLYTFTAYLSTGQLSESVTDMIGKAVISVALDGSPLVRYQWLAFLSHFMARSEHKFLVCAFTTLEEEFAASRYGGDMRSRSAAHGTVSLALWRCLLVLTDDAMPHVKRGAEFLVDRMHEKLTRSPLYNEVNQMGNVLLEPSELKKVANISAGNSKGSEFYLRHMDGTNGSGADDSNRLVNSSRSSINHEYHGSDLSLQQQLQQQQQHQQDQPKETKKSFFRSAVHWIIGFDSDIEHTTAPSSPASVRQRKSLASLFPKSATSPSTDMTPPSTPDGAHEDDRLSPAGTTLASRTASRAASIVASSGSDPYGLHPIPKTNNGGGSGTGNNNNNTNNGSGLTMDTEFREFCVEYFREPLLKPAEPDEPGSKPYFEKLWRKSRNEKIMAETQVQKGLAVTGSWGNQTTSLEGVGEPAKKMVFAQFEPHLIGVDSNDVVVFDWQRGGKLLNRFPAGRELTDVQFINEDDVPLVLSASRDGIARIFKNYEDPEKCHIVTSWWLFADMVHHQPHSPSVLIDWQQSRGHLLVGGDARVVRVWDAAREQPVGDMSVRTSSQLTSLTSDKVAGDLVFAGFNDGAIHVYDRRMDRQQALVRRWKPGNAGLHSRGNGHSSRILNVRMQRGGPREVASGSVDGLVCLWDVRAAQPVGSFRAHTKEMRCMDLHEHAPVIATASRVAGVWSTSGRRVSTLKGPSSSILSSKISPVGAIAFHPHQMVLAMSNAEEPAINVFHCMP